MVLTSTTVRRRIADAEDEIARLTAIPVPSSDIEDASKNTSLHSHDRRSPAFLRGSACK